MRIHPEQEYKLLGYGMRIGLLILKVYTNNKNTTHQVQLTPKKTHQVQDLYLLGAFSTYSQFGC